MIFEFGDGGTVITLYGFGRIFPGVIGETRDLRIEWALQELGVPYEVHGVDHTGGEHETPEYTKVSPFNRIPAIDDDGFTITESAAIVLYLAEKYGRLIPKGFHGRMKVTQWCFVALSTIEWALLDILLIDKFGFDTLERREKMVTEANRSFKKLERELEDKEWITGPEFTVADILITAVLREVRHTDLLKPYPRLTAYFQRALARPAWQRAIANYAQRLGVKVADIE